MLTAFMVLRERSSRSLRGPLGMAVAASLMLIAFAGLQLYRSRHAVLADAALDVRNLSHSLAQQAKGSIDAVDLVLQGLVERLEHGEMADRARLDEVIRRRLVTLSQVHDIAVLDDTGRWLLSTSVGGAAISSADRAYFEWHRTHRDAALHIGDLIVSRADAHRIVTLSLRYDHPDGTFAGVVRASLEPEAFQRVYRGVGLGTHGIVALDSLAGRVLARVPSDPAVIGRDLSRADLFREQLPRAPQGTYWTASPIDGSWLIAGYETVESYPLLVFVAKSGDEVLTPWRREALAEAAILLAAVAFLLATGRRLWRQHERLRFAEAAAAMHAAQAEEAKAFAEAAREAAEQGDRAKTQFLATMSHEIRTPLNGVLGLTGLLMRRTDLHPEVRRQIGLVASSGSLLLTVVNDILSYARAETGGIDLDLHPFSPAGLVGEVVDTLRHAAEGKGIALRCEADGDAELSLIGDGGRLRQVLHNLIGNAIKFTAQGAVVVRSTSRPAEDGQVILRVSIEDSGIGIAPDGLDRLFKRFSQVDAGTSRLFGGSGLGLAICKSFVEAMGGEIGVRSTPGLGSTFWFALPLAPAARPLAAGPPDTAGHRPAHRRLCILLAEDHEVNREIAVAILESAGHTVDTAVDGAAAVQAAAAVCYDLILMDVQMPVLDGLSAARLIRSGNGASRGTPIIALTAGILPDQVAAVRAAGMDGHVGKPFDPARLLAIAETWTNRRSAVA